MTTEERLPPPPPLDRGNVDDGPLSQVRRPSRLTADPSQEYDPIVSPDGGVLSYVSHRRGNADVFVRFLPGSGRVGEYPVLDHYAADSDPTWAPNGRQIAFISKRDDPKGDLYIYNLRSGDRVPDAVRDAILAKFGESLSMPRSGLATAEVEQLDRISEFLEKNDPLVRISGADREDRGPAWSPDGKTIYYASRLPGEPENVWALDVRKFDTQPLTTEGGFDPAPSRDGKYLVYVSRAADANGGLRVRRLADGTTASLTDGSPIDGFPAFSSDGSTVFFSRYAYDTNEDGKIDVNDRPQIYAVAFRPEQLFTSAPKLSSPWPVTPIGRYDLFPAAAGGRLFYSSDDGVNTDVFAIPETGIFPDLQSAAEDLALADQLAGEPELRLLLLEQTVARRPADDAAAQDARLAAARLRAERRQLSAATEMVKGMLADARFAAHRKSRARILEGRIAVLRSMRSGPGGAMDKAATRKAADSLEALAGSIDDKAVRAEALFEAGVARELAGDALAAAETWQRAVREGDGWARAEAWLASARAYRSLGQADKSVGAYLAALKGNPTFVVPAERRPLVEAERRAHVKDIEAAIANSARRGAQTSGIDPANLPDVGVAETYGERAAEGVAVSAILGAGGEALNAIASLRDLASKHQDLPVLPSLARNEIGDLYVRIGDVESGSLEYASVASGALDARQAQRARLSAAKALLIAGRYEEAVTALGPPPPEQIPGGTQAALARRARKAYVRTLLAKADEEFRLRDYKLSRKSYRAVLAVDAREVRAHRGLIACYAAVGEADRVAAIYEEEASKTPDDPLIRYGVGLAYTYRTPEDKWLPKAEVELKKAVFLDDAAVFPHQTLGFTYEKQEELFGEKGGFERAADQYLLALSLNDLRDDYKNEADLLLNVGNAFYNLENHRRAYEYYSRREKTNYPFDLQTRELIYLERIAKSAFESNRIDEAVLRYDRALAFLDRIPEKDLKSSTAMEHRARLLDERAFALDQGGKAGDASVAYLDAAKANSIAGNDENSARALRNAALKLFEKGTDGGEVDAKSLVDALVYLEDSLDQVKKHGVVKQTEKPKGKRGLFSYDMSFSLSTDASEAVDGFSAEGEQELIFTFVGRIYESLEDPKRARSYYEKKRSMLPAKVPDWQTASIEQKKALLENQIGVLAWESGDVEDAWKEISASWSRSLGVGHVPGGVANSVNLGLMALETRNPGRIDDAIAKSKEMLLVIKGSATPDQERHVALLEATKGELLLKKAAGLKPKFAGAIDAQIRAAKETLAEQAKLVKEAETAFAEAKRNIETAKLSSAELNRHHVAVLRGLARTASFDGRLDDAAKRYEEAAKVARLRGMDVIAHQIDAEAGAVAGDYAAVALALEALEKEPAPILAAELEMSGIEPYYRQVAAQALAKKDGPDGTATLAAMERLRALQTIAYAGGMVPKSPSSEVGPVSLKVIEAGVNVSRARRDLLGTSSKPEGEPWAARRKALDAAKLSWNAAVEEWGAWDETIWTLAYPAAADPSMLAAAIPADAALVYFVAQPDALWTLSCADGACTAAKAGPSTADAAKAKAAAAKTVEAALAKVKPDARLFLVPDAGLYDVASWLPAAAKGHPVSVHRSAAGIIASWNHRGPYHERIDYASTAGATSFLAAASRSDVLRLDATGNVPAGRPLASAWELKAPDGPPPVRRVTARDVLLAAPEVPFIVADAPAKSDPETLLALADLWIRAGAGTVVFVGPEQAKQGDAFAKGELPLASTPALLVAGYPGMNKEELARFGEEALSSTLDVASAAFKEKRWDDAMSRLDRAIYLVDTLKLDTNRRQIVNYQALAAFSAKQWTRGVRYATDLVKVIEASGEKGAPLADALVLQGILQQRAEQFPEAAATLAKATQRYKELGSNEGIAKSLTNLGLTHERALDSEKALDAFRQAMDVEEQLGRTAGVGELERKTGRIYLVYVEDYAKALEHFTKARDLFVKAKDEKGVDEATLEMGLVAERQGRLEESKKIYAGVYDRAVARKDEPLRGKSALFLANTAWLTADYQTAFARVREARRVGEELKDVRLQFLARSTEGLLQWTLNDYDRAIALQREALDLAKAIDSKIDEASTHNNIGIIEREAMRYEKAIAAFQAALEIDRKLGTRWGQAYDLRNLGQTYLKSEQPDKAGPHLQEAVRLAGEIGDKVNGAKATLALADWHLAKGENDKAKGMYQRALEQSLAAHVPEVTWRAHKGLGAVALAANDIPKARKSIDDALAVVEELRAAIKVEELKNGFIANKLDLYDDAIRLALDHPLPGQDPALSAWGYSERSRARSFIDLLANRKIELSSKEDTKRIDDQREMKDRIFAAEDALAKAPAAEKPARARELSDLREKYRDLLVEIRAANPKLSAFVTVEPPTIADVRKVLAADSALLEYHVASRETIVWTITDKTMRVTRLPVGRDRLAGLVTDYLTKMESVRPVDAEARALFTLLVEPALGADLKGKRFLGIAPHGVLHYVPFAALRASNDYLVDRYALFYVPSAAVLPLTAGSPSVLGDDKSRAKVLAIGNPDLGDPSFALPFAELEVADLKLDFEQIDVLTRERATNRWVASNIGKYHVIHFASHGEFDPVNPLFSAIRLARETGATDDGSLRAHDIFGIPLKAELVTLSACQTGLGKIEAGDELIGLNRAFLYAGTRSIMSTLWRVHDGSTAVQVKHFYRNYTREAKADALRDSMRQVREYYPHPAYWAAFALTGEYR